MHSSTAFSSTHSSSDRVEANTNNDSTSHATGIARSEHMLIPTPTLTASSSASITNQLLVLDTSTTNTSERARPQQYSYSPPERGKIAQRGTVVPRPHSADDAKAITGGSNVVSNGALSLEKKTELFNTLAQPLLEQQDPDLTRLLFKDLKILKDQGALEQYMTIGLNKALLRSLAHNFLEVCAILSWIPKKPSSDVSICYYTGYHATGFNSVFHLAPQLRAHGYEDNKMYVCSSLDAEAPSTNTKLKQIANSKAKKQQPTLLKNIRDTLTTVNIIVCPPSLENQEEMKEEDDQFSAAAELFLSSNLTCSVTVHFGDYCDIIDTKDENLQLIRKGVEAQWQQDNAKKINDLIMKYPERFKVVFPNDFDKAEKYREVQHLVYHILKTDDTNARVCIGEAVKYIHRQLKREDRRQGQPKYEDRKQEKYQQAIQGLEHQQTSVFSPMIGPQQAALSFSPMVGSQALRGRHSVSTLSNRSDAVDLTEDHQSSGENSPSYAGFGLVTAQTAMAKTTIAATKTAALAQTAIALTTVIHELEERDHLISQYQKELKEKNKVIEELMKKAMSQEEYKQAASASISNNSNALAHYGNPNTLMYHHPSSNGIGGQSTSYVDQRYVNLRSSKK